MYNAARWGEILRSRQTSKKSSHFIIRYNLRNPPEGRGDATGGVRDEAQIDIYLDALEQLFTVMTAPPWSRPLPIVGREGKTIVYVFDLSEIFTDGEDGALTTVDPLGVPYICLSCRNLEPTVKAERQRAMAEAAHEATHVFNCRERHLGDPIIIGPWRWMHEAMAVYMETVVLQANNDFHRFLGHWVILPEIPLDAWSAHYQASMFLCYIADKMGPEIINRIWTTSGGAEKPLEAIERILMQDRGRKFCSPSPDDDDVFASGYCMDSYFLQDAANAGHARNVFQRHGERSVSESFFLSTGKSQTTGDRLDHLACRYYRLFLESRATKLEVQLLTDYDQEGTTLKGELAIVTKDMRRGPVYKLTRSISSGVPEDSVQLTGEITQVDPNDIDHIVLVVTNCGFRGKDQYLEHDDARQYTITATGR